MKKELVESPRIKRFARKLTMMRKTKKWTQKEAADRLGISQSFLCDLEHSRRTPSVDLLVGASKVYGCTVDRLLGLK